MASKSSVENVAASGAEGNTGDITELQNPSAAGPSGVKAKDTSKIVAFKDCAADNLKESSEIREGHVNVGFENESESSGSQALNQPEKNGSSDSSIEVNLTDPADTIRDAHEAANIARDAAASCLKTVDDSYNMIRFCNKRFDSSARKARSLNANRYRYLAQNYQKASERVGPLTREAERSAELAELSAYGADSCATSLSKIVEAAPGASRERQKLATGATEIANSTALTAYQKKHLLLKGLKESWEDVDSTEILRTESTVSFSDDGNCIQICTIVFAFISAVMGLVFLIVPQFTKLNKLNYDALLALGSLLLVTSSLIFMYRLVRYIYKQLEAVERKRRREMAASIEAELRILEDYFERNGITESLVQAQSQDEV